MSIRAGLYGSMAVAALLAASPGFAQSVLTVSALSDLNNLDPIFTTAHQTRDHGYRVYDTLFAMDATLTPQPQMVGEWSLSDDNLVYEFALRPGLTFHDGSPVTSADVIASLQRWATRASLGKVMMERVAALEAVDDTTFRIRLTEPFGQVIDALAMPSGNVPFIMPAALAATPPDQAITDPTGSGPFRMLTDETVPGDSWVYAKFEDYVPRDEPASGLAGGKVVNFDRLEFKVLPDTNTALSALEVGEIDIYPAAGPEQMEVLQNSDEIEVSVFEGFGSQGWIRFNHLIPPFDDKLARQALVWAVSQEEYLAATVGVPELMEECLALFGCGTPLETDIGTEALAAKNLERARELLAQSNYDGRPVVVMDPTNIQQHHGATQMTIQALRDVGFAVEIQPMDISTMMQRRAVKEPVDAGGWNIFHTGFAVVDIANPLTYSAIDTSCTGENWPGWPCDPEIEALRASFAAAGDDEEKKRIATEIQARVMDFVTHIQYGLYLTPVAYRADLDGMIVSWAGPVFWGVSREE